MTSANCNLEAVDFWNKVLPNVDAPYACHQPDAPEVRPSFATSDGGKVRAKIEIKYIF